MERGGRARFFVERKLMMTQSTRKVNATRMLSRPLFLRVTVVALTSLLIAFVSLFIYWYIAQRLEAQSRAAIAERARSIATMMALEIVPALQSGNHAAVHNAAIVAGRNHDVAYVMVLDAQGKRVTALGVPPSDSLKWAEVKLGDRISADGMTLHTSMPVVVQGEHFGYVQLGLSLRQMHAEIRQSRVTVGIVCAVAVVLSILLAAFLSSILLRPLRDYDQLQESEKNYRDLFENASDLILSLDRDGRLEFVNRAFIETLGYTEREAAHLHISDIVSDSQLPWFNSVLQRIQEREHVGRIETVFTTREGREVVVEGSLACGFKGDAAGSLRGIFRDITERRRAEEAILQEKARFEQLFENVPAGVVLTDESERIIRINRTFERMFGYTLEDIAGKPINHIVIPDELRWEGDRYSRQILQGECVHVEALRRRKDGSMLYVELYGVPIMAGGKGLGMFAMYVDITERRRAEEAMRLEKARFEQLFENAPVGIILADSNERILHANSTFQKMFGYSLSELRGRTINDTIVPASLREEGNELSHRVLLGEPLQAESTRIARDGREVHVEIYGVPIRIQGVPVGVFGMYVDITERKRAETELARLVQAVRSVNECIVITDMDDRILFVNKAFEKTYGYDQRELVGKHVRVLRPASYADISITSPTLEGGWQGELINKRKDGSEFPIYLSTSVVRDEGGKAVALVGVCSDITERKRAEEQRAKLLRDLENINKELNDFAYIVSHDLKAPLRAIGTLVNWLSEDYGDKLGEDGKELLQVLLGRTKRMHDLIEGVLRYSRIGRTVEEVTTVDLDRLLPEIVDTIAPPEHVRVKIHHPLPMIMGEATRIQQVFQNLISNAIKFMNKPNGVVEVGCTRENGYWKFSVADNGPGIEQRHFQKIFQIFQTLSSRDEYESTGIGLTIVKKIVETYGGRIWVESEVGVGTTFYFTLPAEQQN